MAAKKNKEAIRSNADMAEDIVRRLPDDVKRATEAMQRTMRHRKTMIIQSRTHVYEKIF